jgi:ribose transport system permease protein
MSSRAIGYFLARNGTFIGCILLTAFFYYWNSNFLSLLNLRNIGEALSALGVVSIPLALLMIGGAVDLSVGSVASLSGVLAATCMANTGSSTRSSSPWGLSPFGVALRLTLRVDGP